MNNFMKKMSLILTILMVMGSFAACSSKEEKTDVETPTQITQDVEEKDTDDSNKEETKQEEEKKQEEKKQKVEVTVSENLEGKIGVVTAKSLNVRSNLDKDSKVLQALSKGQIVSLNAKMSNNWYKININSKQAFVSGEYVQIKDQVEMYVIKDIKVGETNIAKGTKVLVNGVSEGNYTCMYDGKSYELSKDILATNKPVAEAPKETVSETPKGELVSTFSTNYDPNVKGRSTNISLASKAISVTLEPGQEFVWSQIVGQASSSKGYKSAPVFSGNKVVNGVGGGVCQVSTTLYNAVLAANLEVTERHPHSMKVTYVPSGKDAAVAYGSLDFRFINTADYSIQIAAVPDNGTLTVSIYKK